jgi:hypothetical protein
VILARNARLKRALDLSMKHEHLPKELQEKQTPFAHYLLVSRPPPWLRLAALDGPSWMGQAGWAELDGQGRALQGGAGPQLGPAQARALGRSALRPGPPVGRCGGSGRRGASQQHAKAHTSLMPPPLPHRRRTP